VAALARTRDNARRLEEFTARLEQRHSQRLDALGREQELLAKVASQAAADCQALRLRTQSLSALQRTDVVQVTTLLADLEARLRAIEALLKSSRAVDSE
jgi:phage shock protein A